MHFPLDTFSCSKTLGQTPSGVRKPAPVAILRAVQDPLSHGRCVVISSGHDHILNWIRWNSRPLWLLSNREYFPDAASRELSHCRLEASEEEFASCSRQSGTSPDRRTEFEASDFFLSFFFFQLCLSVFSFFKKKKWLKSFHRAPIDMPETGQVFLAEGGTENVFLKRGPEGRALQGKVAEMP